VIERRLTLLLIGLFLLCTFLLAGSVLAMSSDNYQMNWYVPLTGGGGAAASSTNYAIDYTVGQAVIGASSSTGYGVRLGYWYSAAADLYLYLPIILREG